MGNKMEIMSNSFVNFGQKAFDMMVLSLLWIVTSLPVITIGASSAALYETVHKSFVEERGYLCSTYFQSLRSNWKQATGIWISFVVFEVLLHLNSSVFMLYTEGTVGGVMSAFYEIAAMVMFSVLVYQMACVSRFAMPVGWFVKMGFYMAGRYFVRTLLVLAILFLCINVFLSVPISMVILPGIYGICIHKLIEPVLEKHMPE